MANTDSFIDEVSEEVRRDRLFSLFKRWGWVAVVVVIAIVGGTAWQQWQQAQTTAQSEAFGDALLAALEQGDPDARIAALAAIETPAAEAEIVLALLAAGEASNAADAVGAADRLRAAADTPGLARRYVDLALLKAEMLAPGPEAEARTILEAIAAPGSPYAALAEEQLALLEVRVGNLDAAIDRLRAIERSAAATAGLQQRAAQLIVAIESGATLIDTGPEPSQLPASVPLSGPDETGGDADGTSAVLPDADGSAEDDDPAEPDGAAVEN